MSELLRATILGCGSSGGVPRLGGPPGAGGEWGACNPKNPKNRRRRCSLLIERPGVEGTTRVLIDTSPDMRQQLLDAGVGALDAVLYTHAHADHVHGIDDLRMVVFNIRRRLPVWADAATQEALINRFGYAFVQPKGSLYPPILELNAIEGPFRVDGAGGPIGFVPFRADHGGVDVLGFRVGGLAYLPDAVAIPEESWPVLENLDVWIVDALRLKPHPTHAHLALTLEWIARAKPRRAILTNMHIDLDYDWVAAHTPENVEPAYDGMVVEVSA